MSDDVTALPPYLLKWGFNSQPKILGVQVHTGSYCTESLIYELEVIKLAFG